MVEEQPFIIDQDTLSQLINISGRQRMLSQRIVLLIFHYSHNKDKETLVSLFDAIKLFELSHTQLIIGDEALSLPGLFSQRLKDIFFGETLHADTTIRTFISQVKKVFNLLKADENIDASVINELLIFSTSSLLGLLDEITSAYELEAKISAENMQAQIKKNQDEIASILHAITLVSKKANEISIYTHVVATRLGQTQAETKESKDIDAVATQVEILSDEMRRLVRALVTRVRE